MYNLRRMIPMAFLFIVVMSLSPATGYGQNVQLAGSGDAQEEIWELVITGETEATCNMVLKKVENEVDTYTVTGKFKGELMDAIWGAGTLRCKLKGKTKKSVFVAQISGQAYMRDGHAAGVHSLWAKLRGSLSRSQGFGTWSVQHEHGSPSGKWTAKKIR